MARKHIHFIPWTRASGEHVDFLAEVQDWANSSAAGETNHRYNFDIVCHGDAYDMSTLPWYSEIYVHGHGGKGDHELSSECGANTSLKYDAVADRLISHGLKKTWSGAIKLYACSSGTPTLGRQSFAAKFAQYMRFKKNYHLVSYVGYYGAIDGCPDYSPEGSYSKHKYATMFEGTSLECEVKTKWRKAFF